MTEYKTIFLDTAPVIYALENVEHYGPIVISFLEHYEQSAYFSSVITVAEYFPHPFRQPNKQELIGEFDSFVDLLGITILEVDRKTAERAASIRAAYPGIKGMDSLQLAAAINSGCDLFLTNDRQLRQVKEINCLTLDEWEESQFAREIQ